MNEEIIRVFKEHHLLLSFEKLKEYLPNYDENELAKELTNLENDYVIMHNKAGEFQLLDYFNLIKGTLTIKSTGYGFIDNADLDVHYYVASSNLNSAISKDIVLAKIIKGTTKKDEATVERIIKRNNNFFVGKIIYYHKKYYLKPSCNYGPINILIKPEDLNGAQVYDFVKIVPTKYFDNATLFGKVTDVLGKTTEPFMDQLSIAAANGANISFDEDELVEARSIPQEVDLKDPSLTKYVDKTGELIVTIDGDDAKDFDDAINVKRLDNGNYQLGVYIADVSHYVTNDSLMDLEAIERGCSIYLIDKVIPMLPFELSNGICSLNENVNRLTLACEMEIDKDGQVVNYQVFPAIIKSHKRLTYHAVNELLKGSDIFDSDLPLKEMLLNAKDLADILKDVRLKRGSFFFETKEGYVKLDDLGRPIELGFATRGISEQIIEEFMLICNETIAGIFRWLDYPFIYRVHEAPSDEKLEKLSLKVSELGFKLPKNKTMETIKYAVQSLIKENDPNEAGITDAEKNRRLIVNMELIRSMMKAKYQEVNVGHFGLASEAYTHFTSPIRRYPDLMVHRLLKEFILNMEDLNIHNSEEYYARKNTLAITKSNQGEKISETIERDVVKLKQCEFMQKFIGEKFEGTISSITSFGIFVELDNAAEGLARYADMKTYFEYDELTDTAYSSSLNLRYSIGKRVKVKINDVSLDDRQIEIKIL